MARKPIAGADPLEGEEYRASLAARVMNGPDAPDAQAGKEAVFSEVRLCSMVRTDRYKLSVDTLTREPLDLYDMEEDPNELNNLVADPAYGVMREGLMENHLNKLLDKLDHAKLKKYQDARTANPKLGTWQALEASI